MDIAVNQKISHSHEETDPVFIISMVEGESCPKAHGQGTPHVPGQTLARVSRLSLTGRFLQGGYCNKQKGFGVRYWLGNSEQKEKVSLFMWEPCPLEDLLGGTRESLLLRRKQQAQTCIKPLSGNYLRLKKGFAGVMVSRFS